MYLGIDHLVIAVADPDAAADHLASTLGLEVGGGGRHQVLGTFNRLIWLGDTYLELIGVADPTLAAESWIGRPTLRTLEREGGPGLATWAIATDDIDADVARLHSTGSDLAEPVSGERRRPDGTVVRWRLAMAPGLGPTDPPFLIEHDAASAEWTPADRALRAAGPVCLTRLELGVDDLARTTRTFARSVGSRFRPSLAGGGARDADVGAQLVSLRPGRPGAVRVELVRSDRDPGPDIDALGIRWSTRRA